ncbi:hypothetical protein ABZT43_24875, partial [Streptomyces sp. NPDC005349]
SKARTSMEMASGGTRVTIRGEGVYDYRARVGRLPVSRFPALLSVLVALVAVAMVVVVLAGWAG